MTAKTNKQKFLFTAMLYCSLDKGEIVRGESYFTVSSETQGGWIVFIPAAYTEELSAAVGH